MKFIYGLALGRVLLTLPNMNVWHDTLYFCFAGTTICQLETTARTLQFLDLGSALLLVPAQRAPMLARIFGLWLAVAGLWLGCGWAVACCGGAVAGL